MDLSGSAVVRFQGGGLNGSGSNAWFQVDEIRVGTTFRSRDGNETAEVLALQPAQADIYRVRVGGLTVTAPKPNAMRVRAILRVKCGFMADAVMSAVLRQYGVGVFTQQGWRR